MNLIAAVCILLVTILAFQTTVINGAKSLAEYKQHSSPKEHLTVEAPQSKSGAVLIRNGRGAKSSNQGSETAGVGKRGKNSKKLNKSTHLENSNAPAATAQGSSAANQEGAPSSHQEQKHQQTSASPSSHQHNNKPKQRQMLKSQQHQSHVKRGGGGVAAAGGGSGNGKTVAEKKSEDQKQSTCRYAKSAWTECDTKTNSRSRTLTLKKGESNCLQTRTIQKKCKKACRYEKGVWTECASAQMTRQDKLKTTSDTTCEPVRSITKKCNPGGKPKDKGNKERKNKDKGSRKAAAA